MPHQRGHIENKSWEEVVNPIFKQARDMFNWKIEKRARRYADMLRRGKSDGRSRKLMAIAGVYASLKDSSYRMSMRKVAKEFGVAELSVRKYFEHLVKIVEGKDGQRKAG